MAKRSIVRLFESRKGNLDFRVNRDYVRNGIATIPCRISDYSDVINIYSVKGFEIPNVTVQHPLRWAAEQEDCVATRLCPLRTRHRHVS